MPKLNVGSAEEQAQAELKFTETLLTYARHAMTGRVHFSRVSPNIDYKLAFDADDVLKKIAASNDLRQDAATQFNPPQPGYRALKAKLAEMRDAAGPSQRASRIENGPVLRYTRDSKGKETVMADPRVPLLRERLGLAGRAQFQLQRRARHGGRQVPEGQRHSGHRPVERPDHRGAQRPEPRQADSTPFSPPWSAGAGCRATSARPTSCSTSRTIILRVYNNGAKVWQTRIVVGKPGA